MKTVRNVLLIAAGCLLSACADETGPTATAAAPLMAGTWKGTVTCEGRSGPVTVKFEQTDSVVNGSTRWGGSGICNSCGSTALIYARLVEGLPWSISGTVSYKSSLCYPYYDYSAVLTGSLEGSPVSRISARTGTFKSKQAPGGKADERSGIQLELTTRSAP